MDFIAENLAIIISAVIGIVLLIVEMFMPGFGIPGLSGIALLIASVYFTWANHGLLPALAVAAVELIVGAIAVALSLRSASKGRLSKSALVLKGGQTKEQGFIAMEEMDGFVGKTGITHTVLRPAGIAEIAGERLNVVTAGEFVQKGSTVVIKEVEGAKILVEEVQAHV